MGFADAFKKEKYTVKLLDNVQHKYDLSSVLYIDLECCGFVYNDRKSAVVDTILLKDGCL